MIISMKKFFKYYSCILLFALLHSASYSQQEDSIHFPKQAIGAEVLGQGAALFTVNYERKLLCIGNRSILIFRLGVGYIPGDSVGNKYQKSAWTFPFIISSYIGHTNHFLAIGAGYTVLLAHNFVDSTSSPPTIFKNIEYIFSMKLGYRYYSSKYGFFIEAYPMLQFAISGYPSELSRYSFGVSMGSALKHRKKHR